MNKDDDHIKNQGPEAGRPVEDDDFLVKAVLVADDEPSSPEPDQTATSLPREDQETAREAEIPANSDGQAPDESTEEEPGPDFPSESLATGDGGASAADETEESAEEAPASEEDDTEGLPGEPETDRDEPGETGFIPASEEEPPLKVFRPALRSMWFLFFGILLGPAIIYFERDPNQGPAKWIVLSLVCLGLIIHRLSLSYALSPRYLTAASWWGLGRDECVTLARISEVRPRQGFVGRLVGCAHLEVTSSAPDEPGLNILGQRNFAHLARELESLAQEARSRGETDAGRQASPAPADSDDAQPLRDFEDDNGPV